MSHSTYAAQIALLSDRTIVPAPARVAVIVAVVWTKWAVYRRTRKTLAGLEPHLLRDIGITQSQADEEAARPFWRD